ncbi:2-nitropropane dioxygenase [Mortierella sp. GBAus27b]|nr:2-nitropropane dioxygenase [Mortierella sp. GBAus27b]
MSTTKNAFLATFKHITRNAGAGASTTAATTTTTAAATRVARITKPIVSAPMNGWSGVELVTAVSNHGGFPIYPIGYFTDQDKILKELQSIPPRLVQQDSDDQDTFLPIGVGFITFWLDRQGPELLLNILKGKGDQPRPGAVARPPAAVWFSFGDYRPYLKLIREHGLPNTKVIVQVQSVQDALEAQKNHVDVVVLQGTESGGHGAQRVSPLLTLLPEAVQALKSAQAASASSSDQLSMPAILAAGGVVTAPQLAAVQAMGASGVVVGTGFMPTHESPGSDKGKDRLIATGDGGEHTVRTRIFDELREFNWPQGYDGRVVRNLVTEREEEDLQKHGLFEQGGLAAFKLLKEDRTGTKEDWARATRDQDFDLLPLFSGTGVGMLKKRVSAAEFMDQLMGDQQ